MHSCCLCAWILQQLGFMTCMNHSIYKTVSYLFLIRNNYLFYQYIWKLSTRSIPNNCDIMTRRVILLKHKSIHYLICNQAGLKEFLKHVKINQFNKWIYNRNKRSINLVFCEIHPDIGLKWDHFIMLDTYSDVQLSKHDICDD